MVLRYTPKFFPNILGFIALYVSGIIQYKYTDLSITDLDRYSVLGLILSFGRYSLRVIFLILSKFENLLVIAGGKASKTGL